VTTPVADIASRKSSDDERRLPGNCNPNRCSSAFCSSTDSSEQRLAHGSVTQRNVFGRPVTKQPLTLLNAKATSAPVRFPREQVKQKIRKPSSTDPDRPSTEPGDVQTKGADE